MVSWLVILAIALITTAIGSVIVLQFLPLNAWRTLDGLFASLVLGVVSTGWLALLLAELGVFSLSAVSILWLLLFLALAALAFVRRSQIKMRYRLWAVTDTSGPAQVGIGDWLLVSMLAIWLLVAVWLFFRPHEYILGGADAGVYVSLGAEIAQNGGFVLQDKTLAAIDQALKDVALRPLTTNPVAPSYLFPGFYVTNAVAGTVVPQFYPLHPVWQAVAFSMAGSTVEGVRAELLITGLWMTLASLAIILTARELGGWPAALLIMAGLSIAALQVWFARYPTTEAMTQFLLWSGLWALVRWLGGEEPLSLWALVAGSALGAVFLVRIDILVLLPIFAVLGGALWLRGWRRSDCWFLIPFLLLVAHSFLHGALFSAPYFSEHIGYGLRSLWANWWIIVLAFAGGLLVLWIMSSFRDQYPLLRRYRDSVLIVLIAAFLLYAIYGWFVRPVVLEPNLRPDFYSETLLLITNHENWWRLGWYLSIPGIWLGVAGICLLIWRVESKTAVLVATGVLFSIIYLWNVRANPHHVYVMRRYVPAVVPFFLLAGAYLISQLPIAVESMTRNNRNGRKLGLLLAALISVVWLGFAGWSARGFISQVDNQGVLLQLAAMNEDLPPESVLLFNDQSPVGMGDFWGTPLNYIFGHDAFTIRDVELLREAPLAETIKFWQNNGRMVVWIGNPQWLDEQGFSYDTTLYNITSRQLESSYEHKPQRIIPVSWRLEASFLEPAQR